MADLPAGQVTLADLFHVLTAIQTNLATMSTKLEVIDSRNKSADAIHSDHESRLRALEAFRWKLAGLAVALGILAGFLTAWAPGHLH